MILQFSDSAPKFQTVIYLCWRSIKMSKRWKPMATFLFTQKAFYKHNFLLIHFNKVGWYCLVLRGLHYSLPFSLKLYICMVLVLAIGDFLIPQNKLQVPLKFQKLLVPGELRYPAKANIKQYTTAAHYHIDIMFILYWTDLLCLCYIDTSVIKMSMLCCYYADCLNFSH